MPSFLLVFDWQLADMAVSRHFIVNGHLGEQSFNTTVSRDYSLPGSVMLMLETVVRSIRLIIDALSDAHAYSHRSNPWANRDGHSRSPSTSPPPSPNDIYPALTPEHLKLMLRLAPLVKIEELLFQRLCPDQYRSKIGTTENERSREAYVNSSSAWKARFMRKTSGATDEDNVVDWDDRRDPAMVMHACTQDMMLLWRDPTVQRILAVRKIRLEEIAGL